VSANRAKQHTRQQHHSQTKLTPEQIDTAKYLINELKKVKIITKDCSFNDTSKNETCFIHVDESIDIGFFSKHIKFDASASSVIDLKVYIL
jgi:hypothetical protein